MDKQNYYGEHAYHSQQPPWQRHGNQTPPKFSLERALGNSQGEVPQEIFLQFPPKEMRNLERQAKIEWTNNERYGATNHRCLKPVSLSTDIMSCYF